jgi:hypothetical protein
MKEANIRDYPIFNPDKLEPGYFTIVAPPVKTDFHLI